MTSDKWGYIYMRKESMPSDYVRCNNILNYTMQVLENYDTHVMLKDTI